MSRSQWTVASAMLGLQGVFNTAVGIYGVLRPTDFVTQLKPLGIVPENAAVSISVQLICIGAFALCITREPRLHRPALVVRIATHVLTGYLLWQTGAEIKNVAYTELSFAAMNSVALAFSLR